MAADNHTTIVGNLVDDPELRFTNNGIAVTNLRVAVTQRVQQDGEWRDGDTSSLRVNVWRGQAEHLADSLSKGDRVMVIGRLRQRSCETPEGDQRSVTDRFSPSGVSQLRWRSRPVTITRSPLARESARFSAWPRQTLTLKKLVSPSRHWPSCWTRWVTATRRLVTAIPLLVKRTSGSSTRLPTIVVWLSAAISCSPYLVLIQRSGPTRSGPCRVRVGWVRARWRASAMR